MLLRQLGFLFSRRTKGNRKEIFFKGILLVWTSQINQTENAKMAPMMHHCLTYLPFIEYPLSQLFERSFFTIHKYTHSIDTPS